MRLVAIDYCGGVVSPTKSDAEQVAQVTNLCHKKDKGSLKMKKFAMIMAIAGLILAATGAAQAADYYVDTTGAEAWVISGNRESGAYASWAWTNNGFDLSTNNTLTMKVDGGIEQTITFNTIDFADIAKARVSEIAAVITRDLVGGTASVFEGDNCNGQPQPKNFGIRSSTATGGIQVTGGTANTAFGFSTSAYSGSTGTSAATPWKSLNYALQTAGNGDTIHVATGTYNESVNVIGKTNLTIVGSGANRTGIINADGSVPGNLGEFDGPGAAFFIQNSSNVTIKNFTTTKSETWGTVYLNNSDRCTIENNHVKSEELAHYGTDGDALPYGIYMFQTNTYHTIKGNLVEDTTTDTNDSATDPDGGYIRGIFMFDWGGDPANRSNNVIDGNEVLGYGRGIQLSRADNNVIKNNDIHDNDAGIVLWHADSNTVEYNVLTDNADIIAGGTSYGVGNTGIMITLDSDGNIIEWNDLVSNADWENTGDQQGGEDPTVSGNLADYNYYDDWTSPDADNDGIVDNPYLWEAGVIVDQHPRVPEPATMCLLALGGIGVLIRRRRK